MFRRSSREHGRGRPTQPVRQGANRLAALDAGKDLLSFIDGQVTTAEWLQNVEWNHAASLMEPARLCLLA
jgi:hypothetical protein